MITIAIDDDRLKSFCEGVIDDPSIQFSSYQPLVVTDRVDHQAISQLRNSDPSLPILLLTQKPLTEVYKAIGAPIESLHIFIMGFHSESTSKIELLGTFKKILSKNIFGIEHYLNSKFSSLKLIMKDSKSRDSVKDKILRFAEAQGINSSFCKIVWGIAEEMQMNALFDAPHGAGLLENTPDLRKKGVNHQDCLEIEAAYDGQTFCLAMRDPFGVFERDKFYFYLQKALSRKKGHDIVDTKPGGAGLGLLKIQHGSHAVICNVKRAQKTEVIVLIYPKIKIQDVSLMPRSLYYFEE